MELNTDIWVKKGIDLLTEFTPKIALAIGIWILGSWIIKVLVKLISKNFDKSDNPSLKKYIKNLSYWSLKALLIIAVLGTVGIETTSFAAIIGAAGLAIGLALQGSLANFAGGILIMLFKPFKVGDLIEAQGEIGSVKEIETFNTRLTGLSNKEIIIPNGVLSNGTIINYTSEGTRRVDLVIGVSYDADIKTTKQVLINVLNNNSKVLQEPKPTVNVLELADSSVNFAVRPWCNTDDYWDVYFEITERIKIALDEAGIEIPYPHVQIQQKS